MKSKFPFKRVAAILSIVLVYSLLFGIIRNCNDIESTKIVTVKNGAISNNDDFETPLAAEGISFWKAKVGDYDFLNEDNITTIMGEKEKEKTTTPPPTTTTLYIPKLAEPFAFKTYSKPLNPTHDVGPSVNLTPVPNTPNFTMKVKVNGNIVDAPVYDVVCSLVQKELNNAHPEALKAQAVASYTYYKFYESQGNPFPVTLKSSSQINQQVKDAVSSVLGIAMYHNGQYINASYCASTGGATANASDVWGGNQYPYLKSVPSEYDEKNAGYYKKTITISQQNLRNIIESKCGIKLPDDPTHWFEFLPAEQGGVLDGNFVGKFRINKASGGYITRTGRQFREEILGKQTLRSAKFNISYFNGNFTITCYGSGHGVGLSQIGADCYAKYAGYTYDQILRHYYTGVTIK